MLPFLALPLLALSALGQTTGVSHPDQQNDTDALTQTAHYAKPSHATVAVPQETKAAVAETAASTPYDVSYPATGPAPQALPKAQATPALIVRQPAPARNSNGTHIEAASYQPEPREPADNDDGIVTTVPTRPHELASGTVLKARLKESLSTQKTAVGSSFSAVLLADAGHSGEVLLPAGSIIHGRITAVHGGKRIGGVASMRLQPQSVTLPDGTLYPLQATVSGLDGYADGKVTDEGAIQAKGHPKETAAALGLATGTAAVTGAVVAGGVGAVIGAGIGAGIGTVVWLKQDQQEKLPPDTILYFSLDEPLQLASR